MGNVFVSSNEALTFIGKNIVQILVALGVIILTLIIYLIVK